jgi:hypothetical protein
VKAEIARKTIETKTRQFNKSQIDRPQNLGKPQMKWGSDVAAEVTRRLNLKYIALVPGASYRGFHDSIVNYLGNTNPQMVICLRRACGLHRRWLWQSNRGAHGGSASRQCRVDACKHADLQRMV